MRLVKAAEMRQLDQEAMTRYQIPGLVLMENAGLSVVKAVLDIFWDHSTKGKKALVVAGPGNNGGDGLVVARHLYNRGAEVEVFLAAHPDFYRGDAAVNMQIIKAIGVPYHVFGEESVEQLQAAAEHADLIIDALLGTGFKGAPREPIATMIDIINRSGKPVLAVDLPSGLDADSGRVEGACVRAKCTVTMGFPKVGLYVYPGAEYAGRVVVGDISFPPELRDEKAGEFTLLDQQTVAGYLPLRLSTHHKGNYGHVLVVGGSRGYTGAAVLAANAALRSGAGLVTAVVPQSLYQITASKLTEAMTFPAPDTDGGFSGTALNALSELLRRANVLAIGPGLGQHPETAVFLRELLSSVELPMVIDADALNILAKDKSLLLDPRYRERRRKWVLTPHPGEMARLLGTSIPEVQNDRVESATRASREWGVTVVLKGAGTVIAAPDGKVLINPTGNPGLASGGTGDVLTGLIAGLLAQGLEPLEAAGAGVFIHGWAADRIASRKGMAGLVAGDLIEEAPFVLRDLYRLKEMEAVENGTPCLGGDRS
ncbi:MAG: NAD(P)H-hydrate dehydratase [Thermacetogeniaceae bacterium]